LQAQVPSELLYAELSTASMLCDFSRDTRTYKKVLLSKHAKFLEQFATTNYRNINFSLNSYKNIYDIFIHSHVLLNTASELRVLGKIPEILKTRMPNGLGT